MAARRRPIKALTQSRSRFDGTSILAFERIRRRTATRSFGARLDEMWVDGRFLVRTIDLQCRCQVRWIRVPGLVVEGIDVGPLSSM
jgi:hypothetical protein